MIEIDLSTFPQIASNVLFVVKLFESLGNVILVVKCSVKHASQIGWEKIQVLNAHSNVMNLKYLLLSVEHYSDSIMTLTLNVQIRNVLKL